MLPISRAGAKHSQNGYTFAVVLVAMVAVALFAQVAAIPPAGEIIRNREAELLFRGQAYQRAIASYYRLDPAAPRFPSRLEELVDDLRANAPRHIRRLYADPMGGDWVLIRAANGGISGVTSSSNERPRRTAFFPKGFEHFESASSYADWDFTFDP